MEPRPPFSQSSKPNSLFPGACKGSVGSLELALLPRPPMLINLETLEQPQVPSLTTGGFCEPIHHGLCSSHHMSRRS